MLCNLQDSQHQMTCYDEFNYFAFQFVFIIEIRSLFVFLLQMQLFEYPYGYFMSMIQSYLSDSGVEGMQTSPNIYSLGED